MALKRNETYPGRFNNPTTAHPQGAFKNRTAPGAQDGSYLEASWANDWDGFFARVLNVAGVTPNGTEDSGTSSQLYDALLAAMPGRLLGAPKVYVTSGSYTPGANVKAVVVELIGGGGGGGSAQSSTNYNAAGGGGGGGGYSKKYIPITSTTPIAYNVGLGGNGAVYPALSGTSGGATTFGSGFSATGGNGGNTAAAVTNSSTVGAGGAGGTATGGNINSTGSPGLNGVSASPAIAGGTMANGYGGSTTISGPGGAGGGGPGAATTTGNQTLNGNRGNDGMVIIWEFA